MTKSTIASRFYPDGMTIMVMDTFGWEKLLLTKEEMRQLYKQLTMHFEKKLLQKKRKELDEAIKTHSAQKRRKAKDKRASKKTVGRVSKNHTR